MAPPGKRRVSVTLDADVVEALEAEGGNVSAQVNEALREEMARRRRQMALGKLLDDLTERWGPLDSPEDEAEIQRYMRILSGDTSSEERQEAG